MTANYMKADTLWPGIETDVYHNGWLGLPKRLVRDQDRSISTLLGKRQDREKLNEIAMCNFHPIVRQCQPSRHFTRVIQPREL